MRAPQLEVANFHLTFGAGPEQKVMIDFLEEIVIPAFMGDRKRMRGESHYLFHSVQWVQLSEDPAIPLWAVAGRLVKRLVLASQQRLVEGKLVPDDGTLESDPSSVFALIVENHKLLYVREMDRAPTLNEFKTTVESFVKEARREYVRTQYEAQRTNDKPLSHDEIDGKFPLPHLELIPLGEITALGEFLKKLAKLQNVRFRVVRTNAEVIDSDPFFETLQQKNENIGGKTAVLDFSSPDGLNKADAEAQIGKALGGNIEITLRGKDQQNNIVKGSNEDFIVKKYLTNFGGTVADAATTMYTAFKDLAQRGMVAVKPGPAPAREKVRVVRKDKTDGR